MQAQFLRRPIAVVCALSIFVLGFFGFTPSAFAGSLSSVGVTLSNTTAEHASTTHTFSAVTSTTDTLKQINFQYATSSGSNTKPAHLNLSGASISSTSNIGSGWSIDLTNAASGMITITHVPGVSVNGGTTIGVVFAGITNSAIDDCQPANNGLEDTCAVDIVTYDDYGSTTVDTGTAHYTVDETPTMQFEVKAVTSGSSHNGITTTITSTPTSLPFGNLQPGVVKYIAQELVITTNAPGGYSVTVALDQNIGGAYTSSEIDPFGATNATWTTPQTWQSPDGAVANSDTGWFGANTNDSSVAGWTGSTSGKFGPISPVLHEVAYSAGPSRSGKHIFVTYALEVNGAQPSDVYSGNLHYQLTPSY